VNISIDKKDLDFVLKSVMGGHDILRVKSFANDEIILALNKAVPVSVKLQNFVLSAGSLSAEVKPTVVRVMLSTILKKRNDKRARINGNRIFLSLPKKLTDQAKIEEILVDDTGIHVSGRMK